MNEITHSSLPEEKGRFKMAVTAYKIKRRLKKDDLTFVNVEKILNELGYTVVFFNTPDGDAEISRYMLEEKTRLKAFTYASTAHIVFIDGNLHADDRLYLVLHELGHIVLGHIGDGRLATRNSVLIDIDADNFAHSVINGNKRTHSVRSSNIVLVVAFAIFIVYCVATMFTPKVVLNNENQQRQETTDKEQENEEQKKKYSSFELETNSDDDAADEETEAVSSFDDEEEEEADEELVYVTSKGKKFHRRDCQYIRGKNNLAEYKRSIAERLYSPCSACRP